MLTRLFTSAVALLIAASALISCKGAASPTGKPVAVATIFSYYDALRAIAGDKVETVILLPARISPHVYQSTLKDRATVDRASLIIKNGLQIDDWVDRLASTSRAKILTISKDADVLNTEALEIETAPAAPEHAHEHDHAAGNPHIWLDPLVQIKAAEKIRDALIELSPADKPTFDANAAAYIDSLKKLDADFRAATDAFKHKDFIGFHAAYAYLAHRYGLRQVAAIEEVPEAGLSKGAIDRIIDLIKKDNVAAIFTEDAFPAAAVDRIQESTSAKRGVLQPLETYNQLSDTYESLMRKNLAELQRTLGQ